jgi:hypothetical protein
MIVFKEPGGHRRLFGFQHVIASMFVFKAMMQRDG